MNERSNGLFTTIQRKYDSLSKGQKLIADYILENSEKVAFMTASKLAGKVGVSESTVVRFANALGYGGYPNLQKELQDLIKNQITTVERLELSNDYNDKRDILKNVMKADIDNIRRTIQDVDSEIIEAVVDMIFQANRIYILGLRSSVVLAQYLGFYMNFIFDNVYIVPSGANDIFDQLINIKENDLLIGITFPRYSKKTLEAIGFANKKGAKIIGITDSTFSPIKKYSEYILTAPSNMTSVVDSLVAPMSLINLLIIALSIKEKDKVASTFENLEKIWTEYNIYLKR